jgi:Family of unknown function (DUF6056)
LKLITLVALCTPMLALAVVGAFSRYAADDYCTAGQVATVGIAEAQRQLYLGWSGRFAATLLISLAEVGGPGAVPALSVIALAAWVMAGTVAVRAVGCVVVGRLVSRLDAAMVAAAVVFATLQTTADLPQNVFWQTGLVTYLAPLVIATALVAWIARAPQLRWHPVAVHAISAGLAVTAGGTSETFAAAQVVALGLALFASVLTGTNRRTRASIAAALVGATLALAIVAVSPGNEVREASSDRLPIPLAANLAIQFTSGWLRLIFARPHAAALGALVAVAAWVGAAHPARGRVDLRWVGVGASIAVCTLLACMLPAFYALGSNPPGRAQLLPDYVVIVTLGVSAWWAGRVLQRHWSAPIKLALQLGMLVLLVLGPVGMAASVFQDVAAARTYAAAWDQLDAQLRNSRGQVVTISALEPTGAVRNLAFVGPDPDDWFNGCVARYYGLRSIAASK